MKSISLFIAIIFVGLSFISVHAATKNNKQQSHNHNGRVHTHKLPTGGVKHYHKHVHNGRAHIHPYSAQVGFNHSHNLNPRAKAWANAVKHKHENRSHSHPLPRSGIEHQHPHKHGGRIHKHPFPISGSKHFHRLKTKSPAASSDKTTIAKEIRNLIIKQQIASVLKNTPKSLKPKTITSVLNQDTINKVLSNDKYIAHKHDGRTHRHVLPETREEHIHKHAHAGRIHSHLLPVSEEMHKHKSINLNSNKSNTEVKSTIHSKNKVNQSKKKIKISKLPINNRKVAIAKKPSSSNKPLRTIKPRPKKNTAGNRQFAIALRYENGTGVERNFPQAFNWYLRAAKQGHAKAQSNLASLYENGEGVKRNIPEAIKWYTTAANNGDANAQVNLGNRYAKGINVGKNISEAAKWYKRAADQGSMRGRANLNYLIEVNNGVLKR